MKIIDLLNKIANDEDVPKKIKYENKILYLEDEAEDYEPTFNYYDKDGKNALFEGWIGQYLNDEVEILEEEKEQVKPLTKKDIEALGYACGEIQKCFTNGWTKSLENKPLEEENKIPEKLDYCEENTFSIRQTGMTKEDRRLLDSNFKELGNKINSIIDYLKSKGE